jgi:hypothetical protein
MSEIKSTKCISKLYCTCPPGDRAIHGLKIVGKLCKSLTGQLIASTTTS